MGEGSIHQVFGKIREMSARGIDPRPFIVPGSLAQELGASMTAVEPYLVHLKNMRLILFNHKQMTAFKLTLYGLQWDMMPR